MTQQPLPIAQPSYILRGHDSQVHVATFIWFNARLVTADAEGWVVVWSLAVKRPTAVWRAHEGAILGVRDWGMGRLVTHGKDNKLVVWRFSLEEEGLLSKVLPVDASPESRKQPWLLHVLHVNTMNFCSFAQCAVDETSDTSEELLLAVPNTLSSESVDVFHLPSEKRIHTVPNSKAFKGGMIMAIHMFHHPHTHNLTIIAGYESGHTTVSALLSLQWQTLYISHPHQQPILSLSPSQPSSSSDDDDELYYLTSSADANIAKHPIPSSTSTIDSPMVHTSLPLKVIQTKHSGQQSLQVRNDGKIFATAGWDARVRVYGVRSMMELAVLKWHKEGCYAVAFADVEIPSTKERDGETGTLNEEDGSGKRKEVVKAKKSMTIAEARERKAITTHWLAVGSKDGKVSLWDIY